MNNLLQLKGTFQQRASTGRPNYRNIPKNANPITSEKLSSLLDDLQDIAKFWAKQNVIKGCLIDVNYIDVIAKSNRISGFLVVSGKPVNKSVVGARFAREKMRKHIITHYVKEEVLTNTINNVSNCIRLLNDRFGGNIDYVSIQNLQKRNDINYTFYNITKTTFRNILVDTHYIESFSVPDNSINTAKQSIITIYKTDDELITLMKSLGINVQPDKIVSETTLLLYPDEIALLSNKAPYLIAMATEDISKLSFEDFQDLSTDLRISIDPPNNEPIIGVIDTLFDDSVYFSKWVEYKSMINDEIPTTAKDYEHGTSVTSVIVDGPNINPDLDDGCGRFRVRHFGVASMGQYSSFSIMKSIKEIVATNPDIKVWNLSLGSDREINPNFISPEASILDELQYKNDIIFIIAGTNNHDDNNLFNRMIGSPADSINAMVVNSTNSEGAPASYSRKGLVLSFFNKPDVSTFGGDNGRFVKVCTPLGEGLRTGTSFAAPWITRKVAYLIEVLGFSREVAKALIVDAAAGWDSTGNNIDLAPLLGHGVVPKRIDDIVKSSEDEIRFVLSGTAEKWDTYSYNLPVPIHNQKHPFLAKATLCYFPSCSINQGVDYTNTELDIYLGRIKGNGIKSINKNVQSVNDGEKHYVYEGNAREFYRKWDNTKHISEKFTERVRARDVYGEGLWGISIKTKERLFKRSENGIKFGIVVTLKEINGINRIESFVHQCELRGWLVNRIDIENQLNIYNKAQEDVKFDVS